jgi:hypothetical protein
MRRSPQKRCPRIASPSTDHPQQIGALALQLVTTTTTSTTPRPILWHTCSYRYYISFDPGRLYTHHHHSSVTLIPPKKGAPKITTTCDWSEPFSEK